MGPSENLGTMDQAATDQYSATPQDTEEIENLPADNSTNQEDSAQRGDESSNSESEDVLEECDTLPSLESRLRQEDSFGGVQ